MNEKILKFIREWAFVPIVIIVCLILFRVIFCIGYVPTRSMEPTVPAGSFFFGNRLMDAGNLERGEKVVFEFEKGVIYMKRVIGLPGETISFQDGNVYIDGELLDESTYLDPSVQTYSDTDSFTIPDNAYFMMGDNRGNSFDARYWADPFIMEDQIVGEVLFTAKIPFWEQLHG